MKQFIYRVWIAALCAITLSACGGVYSTNGATGATGEACGRGEALPSPTCNGRIGCAAGYVPGVVCTASGRFGDCTCVPGITAADAGTAPATGVCVDTETRYNPALACPAGRIGYQTCRYGVWTANECVADLGGTRICNPGSVTMNSCMACTSGFVAQQRCAPDGRSYAACECVSNGSAQTCTPGSVRNACNPCASGSAAGTEWCNEQGTGYTCRINSGATCSGGGSTQICIPGTSRNTACTFSCGSGTAPGTEFCNSAGNGYECRQNSGTSCSGSSTGGGGSCRSQPFTLIVRAVNTSLRVRCWDMNGNPVTSTSNELRVNLSGGCGIVHCVDGDGSAFVESGYWSTSRSESVTNRFDIASVEGREDSLRNQQGQARICPDGGRSKANIAVNADRLGGCL
jgi:hypothetical protein